MENQDKKSTASDKAVDSKQGKSMKLVALNNLSGKYFLPYSIGQKFSIDAKQGQELVGNKDAKKLVAKKK